MILTESTIGFALTIGVILARHFGLLDRIGLTRYEPQTKAGKAVVKKGVDLLVNVTKDRPLLNAGAKRLQAYLQDKAAREDAVQAQLEALEDLEKMEQNPQ